MGVLVVGECLGTTKRMAGNEGNQWEETSIVVLDGMKTEYVVVASVEKFRGDIPQAGDVVALQCAVRTFLRRDGVSVGYSYTAFGRTPRVEEALSTDAKGHAVKV